MSRSTLALLSAALLVASLVPGGSGDAQARPARGRAPAPSSDAPAATDLGKPALKSLRLARDDWKGEYSEELRSWTFEKFAPAGDGTFTTNSFSVDRMPADAPKDVEAYAARLAEDESFQDIGYVFVSIAKKEKMADGWLITGVQKDPEDDEDEGTPAFAMYRAKLGVLCFGSDFHSDALRDEAATACSTAVIP